jgi:hypothetical protein
MEHHMLRRVAIRLISLLLVANGVAGIVAVWFGWTASTGLLSTLRDTSATVTAQQTQLAESVRGVAVAVDDSAQATAGLSQSSGQARASVIEATQTADDLATTFDRLAAGSQVTILGIRPLEGMIQPFATNAEDFRRISASLATMSDSLDTNAREMGRVSDDLRNINTRISMVAANIEALPSSRFLEQGLSQLELGTRLFLALILFEATLSALTGLALAMMTVQPRVHVPLDPAPVGAMHRAPPVADEPVEAERMAPDRSASSGLARRQGAPGNNQMADERQGAEGRESAARQQQPTL